MLENLSGYQKVEMVLLFAIAGMCTYLVLQKRNEGYIYRGTPSSMGGHTQNEGANW